MTIGDLVAANLAVALGSIVQAISGVGGGFISVPMLAWIDLSLVPGFLTGYWLANHLTRQFTRKFTAGSARIAVLAVSGCAAVALMARSLL